jgi:hypothetical protein
MLSNHFVRIEGGKAMLDCYRSLREVKNAG